MKNDFENAHAELQTIVKNLNIVIFLDMDGVISDFDSHLDAQNKRDDNGKTKWDKLDHNWFATMPVYDGALDFYNSLKETAAVKFLTAPTLSPDCYSGKAEWITNFDTKNGKYALQSLMITPSKDKCLIANPNRILIDDRIKNIKEWEDAGGIGIHHTGDFSKTLEEVKQAILDMGKSIDNTPEPNTPEQN